MSAVRKILNVLTATAVAATLLTGCEDGTGPALTLLSPGDGDVVTVPFEVQVSTSAALGPPESGLHHLHIWFGDDAATQVIGEDRIVRITNAPSGEHVMHVSLRHADHTAAGADLSVRLTIVGGTVG